ncbi:sugar ABC transporter ATP-binding protein [Frankia sp. CIT1]|uniref:sugar ABC transporter ATP-binding protein n=1 Tax=Frankia sp. CIT1 TaxID=2880974 RepID=UPI001EF55BC4|nr:sugar ABC transporter ATP-binding protein [Frankia sp. CIT1]
MSDGAGGTASRADRVNTPALDIRTLSKTFSGQVVLDRVDLTLDEGRVHALVGQNGSGKSTLIKILAGYHRPDPGGSVVVRGVPLQLGAAAAHDAGIRFVHQDLGLLLDLSAVENLMLGLSYPRGFLGRIRWREARRRAQERVARVGLDIDVRAPVGELGLADRTGLAIARALPEPDQGNAVLVLDEPTAALPAADVDRLLATIRRLRDAGHSVLIVSHHLDEVLDIADRITVLRDGRKAASVDAAGMDHDTLGRLMVGHDLVISAGREETAEAAGPAVLELVGIAGGTVTEVSTTVRRGEIVGIAGLTGSGREALGAMLSGRLPRTGRVSVDGVAVPPARPAAAMAARLAFVPGERARYGTFADLTVRQNLTMGSLRRHVRCGYIHAGSERQEVRRWVDEFGIVTRGVDAPITSLSGGNQQKVLVARALRLSPKALVLDDPTAGIDVKARDQVHGIIERSADAGTAVLLVSTDSEELARLADRVHVLSHGRVARTLRRGVDLSPEAIDHAQVSLGTP